MPSAFVSGSLLPCKRGRDILQVTRMTDSSIPERVKTSRRRLLSAALTLSATALLPVANALPVETQSVFMDISVAGQPVGRILVGLYGHDAPASVDTFVKLANGSLRNRAGKTAGFKYSKAAKVLPGKRVQLGSVKQIDAINQQSGRAQRQTAGVQVPESRDDNSLHHDAPGLVSVRRGGSFEFSIMLAPDQTMDEDNLVVGRVTAGMDVVERLGKVPTNKKTIRDGYRSIGKVIGDVRANVDVRILS